MSHDLVPARSEATRSVSVDVVRDAMANTSNPKFALECRTFLDACRAGDEVIEFCSALADWRRGQGWSGYRLTRGDEVVLRLIAKMS